MRIRALPLLLVITASLATTVVHAATTGTLRFTGQVNAGTCNLAAGDENRTITLPTIKISDFGATSSAGAFDFEISADCESDLRNVIFLFAGTASTGNAALFSNTGTSKGTALQLLHRVSPAYAIPANGTPRPAQPDHCNEQQQGRDPPDSGVSQNRRSDHPRHPGQRSYRFDHLQLTELGPTITR
ncbi:major type 1 subunit fimbrin (pilin) [Pseudomonas sp. SJZ103]|nr:major type 1 subunit fimbrin (pilin) [Pseudomonas sp. SJZ103]TWC90995.1 major type 1 subunit fimbrin (pilin) [Pseudomonas sp. SJZ094]